MSFTACAMIPNYDNLAYLFLYISYVIITRASARVCLILVDTLSIYSWHYFFWYECVCCRLRHSENPEETTTQTNALARAQALVLVKSAVVMMLFAESTITDAVRIRTQQQHEYIICILQKNTCIYYMYSMNNITCNICIPWVRKEWGENRMFKILYSFQE